MKKYHDRNIETKLNWWVVYVLIPLLPFFVGGFIRTCIIITSSTFDRTIDNLLETLYFSWDSVTLSFSISVIAFIVKNNLTEKHLNLRNKDRETDLANNSTKLFGWGVCNLVLFAILLCIHTEYRELNKTDVKNTHVLFSGIIYCICSFTMRDVYHIQKNYKLKAKFL